MDPLHIAELLTSYIAGLDLTPVIYDQLGAYLQLLLRWNAKTNLTAIRDPEEIVTRHFGESLFAAGVLFGSESAHAPLDSSGELTGNKPSEASGTLADLGSGAGFPGLPIKLAFPSLQVTLIESQNKKATFLKEVIRALHLDGIDVCSGRAEQWGKQADVVTLRAVERLESMAPITRSLVAPGGRLCILVGSRQRDSFSSLFGFTVETEQAIPNRADSVVLVGKR